MQLQNSTKFLHNLRYLSSKTTGVNLVSPLIGLTSDQMSFYGVAREFADVEMKPNAKEWDEKGDFPKNVLKKLSELGFGGLVVNDDVGGSNLSRVDVTIIIEGLATGCVGTTAMLTIHNMCAWMIDKYASNEVRQQYLPSICKLDMMASYCLTEPGSGSDAASLSTKATLDTSTNEYVINGTKSFISGGGVSDLYVLMCRTDATKKSFNGISCILVPNLTPGLSFGKNESKMGWKIQPTCQVIFENVRVPKSNIVGKENQGFAIAMSGLDGGRLSIAACSLGAAQRCFEIALEYTKERKQFGQCLAANQSVQFKLADMAGKLVSSRVMLRHAASLLDQSHPSATAHCALAKKIVTDHGFEVCNDALQLLGGYGK